MNVRINSGETKNPATAGLEDSVVTS